MLCVAIIAVYLLFLPPSSPLDSNTTAADVPGYDYYVDDHTPIVELPGKQSPSPLPVITYLFRIIIALGIAAATVTLIPILMHNLFLSPLIIVTYLVLCRLEYYSSVGLRPCLSAMLSCRAAITLGSERGIVTLLQLQTDVRQGKESGDPTVPARGIAMG